MGRCLCFLQDRGLILMMILNKIIPLRLSSLVYQMRIAILKSLPSLPYQFNINLKLRKGLQWVVVCPNLLATQLCRLLKIEAMKIMLTINPKLQSQKHESSMPSNLLTMIFLKLFLKRLNKKMRMIQVHLSLNENVITRLRVLMF